MKDYYKILGVDKSASKDEIKKAFRKLAHEHHPDKTKNDPTSSAKFKEASEAYSVLSDDDKRKQYDMFGSAGPGGGGFNGGAGGGSGFGGFGGFDFSGFQQGGQGFEFDLGDIFGEFFGGGRAGGRSTQNRGADISVDLLISFEESIFGTEKDILVTKISKCLTCEGTGAKPGSGVKTCSVCNGKGKVSEARRSFLGIVNTTKICENCHGRGQVPQEKCPNCNGLGVKERAQEIAVKIPAGIEDGQSMRLTGIGEAIPFGQSGDLYIKIHVKAHNHIRKEGNNLAIDQKIKLTQAIMGGEVTIKSLDGDLIVNIPEGSNHGDVLRVKGKGVPMGGGKRGDLFIKLNIEMPRKLSKEAKRAVEELKREGV
jgi:molecular chaperone DnaJ